MSKSRGNIVRAEPIRQVMGADALRYFLLREIVFGQDGSFSYDALIGRYNSDLANGLGNLASRTLTMIHQYRGGAIPEARRSGDRGSWPARPSRPCSERFERFEFSQGPGSRLGADLARSTSSSCEQAPWKLARSRPTRRADAARRHALHRRRGAAHRHRAALPGAAANRRRRSGRSSA